MSAVERWPTAVDYQTALQTPSLCFKDPALKQGTVLLDPLGLPKVATGNVVVVFRMDLDRGNSALRCYTRKVSREALSRRYNAINAFRQVAAIPALMPCLCRPDEILIDEVRYPAILMPWAPGLQLHRFIEGHLDQPVILNALADQWRTLMVQLHTAGFAHGDLSDGNVLVDKRGVLRLIDYDAAYVPALADLPPREVGKVHYQHPGRLDPEGPDYGYYGANVDVFSALVIYLTLRALAEDAGLWQRYHSGENLIFDKDDFRHSGYTPIWLDLRSGANDEIKYLTDKLERFCQTPVTNLPDLKKALGSETPQRDRRVTAPRPEVVLKEAVQSETPRPARRVTAPRPAAALKEKGPIPQEISKEERDAAGVLLAAEAASSSSLWRRVFFVATPIMLVAFVVLLILAVRGFKHEAPGSLSLSPPPGLLTAYVHPEDLPGFYTGYATSLDGDREPMALIIDSLVVDSTKTQAHFVYSVNWKAHHNGGQGHYNMDSGYIDLESHYVLYVARATLGEVELASLSHRDERPLVRINKRRAR